MIKLQIPDCYGKVSHRPEVGDVVRSNSRWYRLTRRWEVSPASWHDLTFDTRGFYPAVDYLVFNYRHATRTGTVGRWFISAHLSGFDFALLNLFEE